MSDNEWWQDGLTLDVPPQPIEVRLSVGCNADNTIGHVTVWIVSVPGDKKLAGWSRGPSTMDPTSLATWQKLAATVARMVQELRPPFLQ